MYLTPCPTPDPKLMLPLQQHPTYARALDQPSTPVQVRDDHGPVAYALILRGPLGARTILRGPIWHRDLCRDQKSTALRTLAPRILEAEAPDPAHRAAGFRAVTTPTWVAEWPLGPCAASRWANMHGKWRNALRAALNAPLKVVHGPWHATTDHALFSLARAHARTHKYTPASARIAAGFAQHLPKSTRIFTAHHNRHPVAHMLFIQHGPVVTYFTGWTNALGRKHRAHHRLLEEAALYYTNRGALRIDLGCVDTQSASGLARFKIGTGATIRPLGGSMIRFAPVWPLALGGADR